MNEIFTVITSLLSIAFIIVLVFWLYRDFCTDRFRQELFKLRDEMFDDAARENISFEMPTYALLRTAMNGFIRFGHRMNFAFTISLIFLTKNLKHTENSFSTRMSNSLKSLSDEQQKLFMTYYFRMNFIIIKHFVLSAPVLIVTLFIPLAIAKTAKSQIKRIVNDLKEPLDRLDTAAFASGEVC